MIDRNFDLFVDALEQNNMELLNNVLDPCVTVDSSALGQFEGLETAKKKFEWQGMGLDYYKAKIFNNTIRTKGNRTWQTFYSVLIMGRYEKEFLNLFQCCFINSAEWKNDKMVSLRSNMTFEHGNTLIVSPWWNMIDYSLEYGNAHVVLDGVRDNPWISCPESDIDLSDEEQIRDTFNHYCLSLDLGNFDDLANVATVNMTPYDGSNKGRDVWIENFKKQWARKVYFNGKKYIREAAWNHMNTFKSLEINGDTATADIYRFEPNRIGTRFQHKYNLNSHYYSFIWHMEFKKEEDGWKMNRILVPFDAERGPWQVEYDDKQRYF